MNLFSYGVLAAYFIALCNCENVFNRVFRQVAETINYDKNDQEEGTTAAPWNPLNWFIPKLNAIPYNPDTDLGTVRLIYAVSKTIKFRWKHLVCEWFKLGKYIKHHVRNVFFSICSCYFVMILSASVAFKL